MPIEEALEAVADLVKESRKSSVYRENTAFHQDAGKPPLSLISRAALRQEAAVMAYGAQKYGKWNWRDHADSWDYTQLVDSALRHIYDWLDGEDDDPESGESHLAHVRCNMAMLLDLIDANLGNDDRSRRKE